MKTFRCRAHRSDKANCRAPSPMASAVTTVAIPTTMPIADRAARRRCSERRDRFAGDRARDARSHVTAQPRVGRSGSTTSPALTVRLPPAIPRANRSAAKVTGCRSARPFRATTHSAPLSSNTACDGTRAWPAARRLRFPRAPSSRGGAERRRSTAPRSRERASRPPARRRSVRARRSGRPTRSAAAPDRHRRAPGPAVWHRPCAGRSPGRASPRSAATSRAAR